MASVDWDASDFMAKTDAMVLRVKMNTVKAVNNVADTILNLSGEEVPIKEGILQNSGHVAPADNMENPEAKVGYMGPYAAYQHEGQRKDGSHVVRNYSNPRSKKKFLEDPIRHNLGTFRKYFNKLLS